MPVSGGAIRSAPGAMLEITDSTVTQSHATGAGGGIVSYGTLYMANSTISDNYANSGGGLHIAGFTVKLANVTVTGNSSVADGGGIQAIKNDNLYVYNSSISNNHSGAYGGGLNLFSTTATVINSVIAGNTATTFGADISDIGGASTLDAAYSFFGTDVSGVGTFNDNGGNQNNAGDPLLGALGDHGGTVKTLAILAGSPLIDAGNGSLLPTRHIRRRP